MPVCTTCAHPAQHLYTTYRTKSNIRLGVCPRCSAFLDPLIEHPPLLLILDLILLKPRVFLHLMYNRGTPPLDATVPSGSSQLEIETQRKTVLRDDLITLGIVTLAAESMVRWGHSGKSGNFASLHITLRLILGVALELAAQYLTTLGLALGALWLRGWWPVKTREKVTHIDGRRENFLPILIPLTLLYTSILPLLLHLLLSIWYQPSISSSPDQAYHLPSYSPLLSILLPPELLYSLTEAHKSLYAVWATTDRIWAGTRLLGGMAAGFGLRVVLPTKPWETTGIVLAGWAAAAGVGWMIDT